MVSFSGSEPIKTEPCKVKYAIYIYNEPLTFPNVPGLLSNVATTIIFFDNRCVIFLQLILLFEDLFTTSVVLTCDYYNRMLG